MQPMTAVVQPTHKPTPITWSWLKGSDCVRCKSTRLCHVLSHANDRHVVWIGKLEHCDYLPEDMNIGGKDDNEFTFCMDCGQIQGKWPLVETQLEKELKAKEQSDLEKRKIIKPVASS